MSQTLFYNPFINIQAFFAFFFFLELARPPPPFQECYGATSLYSKIREIFQFAASLCSPGQSVLVSCYVLTLSLSISGISSFPSQEEHGGQSAFTLCQNPSCPRMVLWVQKWQTRLCTTSGTWEVSGSLFIPWQVALWVLCEILLNFQVSKNQSCQILEIQ